LNSRYNIEEAFMAVWIVRAGKYGEQEATALKEGLVTIAWNDLKNQSDIVRRAKNDEDKARQELRKLYEQARPGISKDSISVGSGQVWAFIHRIQIGDLVVLPRKATHAIAIGKVTGDYEYTTKYGPDVRHIHRVKWLRTDIPRSVIGEDLLNTLGTLLTVSQATKHEAEKRFAEMAKTGSDPHLGKASGGESVKPDEPEDYDLEEISTNKILKRINARFKDHDFARLIEAILQAQGYTTFRSPPGPDGGVDILAGKGALGFDAPRLCVQVKSQDSPVESSVLNELLGVMASKQISEGLLVAWGGFRSSFDKLERDNYFKVRLWGADDVMDALFEIYDRLPEDIRADLPLKRIWTIVPDEET
jgi:restriction system protein